MMRSLDTKIRYESDFNEDSTFMLFENDANEECEHFQHKHEDYAYSLSNSSNGSARKMSDPIKFKMKRTDSEIQLMEDEEAAEYRDYCMFLRIAGGMLSQQNGGSDIGDSLDSVIRTHHDLDSKSSRRNTNHRHSRFAPMPHSPDDMPWLERTPSTKTIYDHDNDMSLRGGCAFAGSSSQWTSHDSTSCTTPLPSLVDLVGHAGADMDCDLSVDDGIFILDL